MDINEREYTKRIVEQIDPVIGLLKKMAPEQEVTILFTNPDERGVYMFTTCDGGFEKSSKYLVEKLTEDGVDQYESGVKDNNGTRFDQEIN